MTAAVIVVGLDNAGKSTVMHFLEHGEVLAKSQPTIGYNDVTVVHDKLEFKFW